MQTIKQKNKQNKTYRQQIGGYQKGRVRWVKEVDSMVTDGNQTSICDAHATVYVNTEL